MRGKAMLANLGEQAVRITPAYAGKSIYQRRNEEFTRDHPRVCGEKQTILTTFDAGKGSPPRMRGKENKEQIWKQGYRITPAYAGKRD